MPVRVERSPFERAAQEGLTGPNSNVNSNTQDRVRGRRPDSAGDWAPVFIGALMEGASVTKATRKAGVDITMPFKRRTHDEVFRRAWKEAADIGTELMEQEAARRAYHGTLKPVFHKGERCGYVREYSDTLMIFLLKARNPAKYRENIEGGNNTIIGSINVQNNIQAAALVREMIQRGDLGIIEEMQPLAVTSASGGSGQPGQVEASATPASSEQRSGDGVADA